MVTVLPVPTFLSENAPVYVPLNTSPDTSPVYVTDPVFKVAVVVASYVLFDAVIPDTDKAFAVTSAVVV